MKRAEWQFSVLALVFSTIVIGCTTTPKIYRSAPEYFQVVKNDFYETTISPSNAGVGGWKAFQLTIRNKTDKDLELDWNRTLFLTNGTTNGGFMFEGILYRDRNNTKPPDFIFPHSTFSKTIFPNNLVCFYGSWIHMGMGSGEYGVLLSVKVDGKEIREKLLMNFWEDK